MIETKNQVIFGAAKEIITPRERTTLMGFGAAFGVPFDDIHDDLYARTLLLRDVNSGETVVLIAMDLLFHDDTLPHALREYAEKTHGISPNNLHVSYTHTHFGPSIKGYDFTYHSEAYEAFLFERICSCIDRAVLTQRKGCLKFSSVEGEWNVSRRLPVDGQMLFKPSPNGEVDKNLYLLKLEDENGIMRALAVNFACHPSNLETYYIMSSEYPGRLCQRIEGEFYGCTAMFFQGFGADAKLKIGMKTSAFKGISFDQCDEVALTMLQRIKSKLLTNDWQELPIKLGSRVFQIDLPLNIYPREVYEEESKQYASEPGQHFTRVPGNHDDIGYNYRMIKWAFADRVLDLYDELPEALPLNCGVVRINPNFYICSFGGEPGINIQTVLRENMPDKQLLCFGYNDAIAYVPSDKMIAEGGYEADGSVIEYRLKGSIKPGVDQLYCDGFRNAMNDME